jgi:hypothetical protein
MAEERKPRGQQAEDDEQNRVPRDVEVRSAQENDETWTPPALLPDPPAHPDWVHRWVRTAILGQPDQQNVSTRFREGWEVAPADDPLYAEFQHFASANTPWSKKGVIEVGGLMLCRAPRGKMAARDRYHREQADAQMRAVESQLMSQSDARMPIEKPSIQTKTTFGSRE